MTNEILEKYILNYEPLGNSYIQLKHIDGYDFTFLISDGKAIGGVLDMCGEPHIYILPEYRGKGYGSKLLKNYLIRNDIVGSGRYVYYDASTDDGENLINRFKREHSEFRVIRVGERK